MIEEILEERGIYLDHATVNRWVIKFSPMLKKWFQKRKKAICNSWRMDETYIKIKGKVHYYYRAVDKNGDTIDFYLSLKRDKKAAYNFLKKAIKSSGLPEKVNIDKNKANHAAIIQINESLLKSKKIKISCTKYLNQIIEQDHRFIKRLTRPMMNFKSFSGASNTLEGIELCHMLHKEQNATCNGIPAWKQFYNLVG